MCAWFFVDVYHHDCCLLRNLYTWEMLHLYLISYFFGVTFYSRFHSLVTPNIISPMNAWLILIISWCTQIGEDPWHHAYLCKLINLHHGVRHKPRLSFIFYGAWESFCHVCLKDMLYDMLIILKRLWGCSKLILGLVL